MFSVLILSQHMNAAMMRKSKLWKSRKYDAGKGEKKRRSLVSRSIYASSSNLRRSLQFPINVTSCHSEADQKSCYWSAHGVGQTVSSDVFFRICIAGNSGKTKTAVCVGYTIGSTQKSSNLMLNTLLCDLKVSLSSLLWHWLSRYKLCCRGFWNWDGQFFY